jgi:hypothetical protein
MSENAALILRTRAALTEISDVVERCNRSEAKALRTNDEGYWDSVALNLHGYYSGVERIFEDIARTLDGSLPTGPDWHRSLLVQMAAEAPELRPAVIQRPTRDCLDEYRGFRHVVRNVYAFNFRTSRLKELADGLPGCFEMVQMDLEQFVVYLNRLA